MTIFDLLLLGVALASVMVVLAALAQAVRGRLRQAVMLLGGCGAGLALYLGVVALAGLLSPQRVLAVGEDNCSDDWCIAVERVERSPGVAALTYVVTFRISSRARRVSQREYGVVAYLLDEDGRRYTPRMDGAVGFDALLEPGQVVMRARTFDVPVGHHRLAVAFGREGSSAIPGRFVIGDDGSLFHKPTVVPLR